MIILTSYKNPDIDGIAGMYALAELFKKQNINCDYYIFGKPQFEVDIICKKYGVNLGGIKEFNNNDKFILLDCNDLTHTNKKIKSENIIEVIDHHNTSTKTFELKNAKFNIEQVGAMATLIVEKFLQNNMQISEISAILLYHAIASNTINLKAQVTTDRDKKAFKYLENLYPNKLNRKNIIEIFSKKSIIKNIERTVLSDLKFFDNNLVIGQLEITNIENFVNANKGELTRIMNQIKSTYNAKSVVLNLIDILKGYNLVLYTGDVEPIKKFLTRYKKQTYDTQISEQNAKKQADEQTSENRVSFLSTTRQNNRQPAREDISEQSIKIKTYERISELQNNEKSSEIHNNGKFAELQKKEQTAGNQVDEQFENVLSSKSFKKHFNEQIAENQVYNKIKTNHIILRKDIAMTK